MQAAEPVVPASSAIKGWDARMQQQKGDVHQLMRTEETHGCSCIMSAGMLAKEASRTAGRHGKYVEIASGPALLGPEINFDFTSFPISAEVSVQFPFIESFTPIQPIHYIRNVLHAPQCCYETFESRGSIQPRGRRCNSERRRRPHFVAALLMPVGSWQYLEFRRAVVAT